MALPPLEKPTPPKAEIGGEWMYQVNGIIYGPVDAQTIVEKLYSGELNMDSPLAEGDSNWITIARQPEFASCAARAERELSEYAREVERRSALKKRRLAQITFIVIPAMGVLLLSIAIVAAVFVVKSRKQAERENLMAWAERPPPVISLGSFETKKAEEGLSVEQKEVRKKELTEKIQKRRAKAKTKAAQEQKAKPTTEKKLASAKETAEEKAPPPKTDESDSEDNVKEFLSDADINRVLNANSRGLYPCIEKEAKENPLIPRKIVLEFTVENSGRVGRVSVENPELADRQLENCFKQKMRSWRFPAYYGERRNITLPFNISF